MKFIIALALFAVAAHAHLVPRDIVIPDWQLNPRHTGAEWQEILAAQEFKPEVVKNLKPGTYRQPASAGRVNIDPSIINGADAVIGQFPWQVAVTMDGSSFCGGSLISPTWVLTAGHCVRNVNRFDLLFGAVARSGSDDGVERRSSTNSILHEAYGPVTIVNDIGVVSFTSALTLNSQINVARLPSRSDVGNTFAGQVARVSGWGKTSDAGGVSPTLKWVDLNVITNAVCAQTYGSTIRDTTLCCQGSNGASTCNGDSGGPLCWQRTDGTWIEVGVVSFGSSSGCTLDMAVGFTRVTSYLDWIQTNTGIIIE